MKNTEFVPMCSSIKIPVQGTDEDGSLSDYPEGVNERTRW
jgi:hypothetical protein